MGQAGGEAGGRPELQGPPLAGPLLARSPVRRPPTSAREGQGSASSLAPPPGREGSGPQPTAWEGRVAPAREGLPSPRHPAGIRGRPQPWGELHPARHSEACGVTRSWCGAGGRSGWEETVLDHKAVEETAEEEGPGRLREKEGFLSMQSKRLWPRLPLVERVLRWEPLGRTPTTTEARQARGTRHHPALLRASNFHDRQ